MSYNGDYLGSAIATLLRGDNTGGREPRWTLIVLSVVLLTIASTTVGILFA